MSPRPNRLRRLRGDRPLHEIAAKAAISPSMLSYLERGGRTGTPRVRHRLVAALREATGDEFLTYEQVFPPEQEAAFHGFDSPPPEPVRPSFDPDRAAEAARVLRS